MHAKEDNTDSIERQDAKDGSKAEHRISENPNPAANENIKNRNSVTSGNDVASQAGSEITDGEDG